MGWFDDQIKQRIEADSEGFSQAFADMSSVVMSKRALAGGEVGDRQKAFGAMEEILGYYHLKSAEAPGAITDINERLEFLLRPVGVMRREIRLSGAWYKDCYGPMLGQTRNGDPVALMPRGQGYQFFDWASGKKIRLTDKTAQLIAEEAYCFYKPLPLKKIGPRELMRYVVETLSAGDLALIALCSLAATLLGLVMPFINQLIFGVVAPSGEEGLLLPIALMLLGVTLSSALIGITRDMMIRRIETKMSMPLQAATMMRVLSMPVRFFKEFSAGELAERAQSIKNLCQMLADAVLTGALASVFSLIYVGQIRQYAPSLVWPSLAIIAASVAFSLIAALAQMKITKERMALDAKESGLVFSLFSGVQKLKLAGAEKRAFAKWATAYKEVAALYYNPPVLIKLNAAISAGIALLGGALLYQRAGVSGLSVADFMAFNVAYGMTASAFAALTGMALTIGGVRPILEMVRPLLDTAPEVAEGKKMIEKLSGGIELSNLSFRYTQDMPLVLDDLSLKIRPGQYVAIVGRTGCGKSTLMRLMLGFEKPQKGAIYYDGKDLSALDLKSLRRNIGTVMQEGKLFQGDIYSNIVISAPWLTVEDAWWAAEMAGMAQDIGNMPMGMHTQISEGSGGVSGGQRQRLMIARAIAPKPKILMLDEATSALDNITQRKVSESLDALRCTRVVIAHRLSTIRQCDRIIVLDKGRIIEDGSYDELIAQNGFFADLVARQRLDA